MGRLVWLCLSVFVLCQLLFAVRPILPVPDLPKDPRGPRQQRARLHVPPAVLRDLAQVGRVRRDELLGVDPLGDREAFVQQSLGPIEVLAGFGHQREVAQRASQPEVVGEAAFEIHGPLQERLGGVEVASEVQERAEIRAGPRLGARFGRREGETPADESLRLIEIPAPKVELEAQEEQAQVGRVAERHVERARRLVGPPGVRRGHRGHRQLALTQEGHRARASAGGSVGAFHASLRLLERGVQVDDRVGREDRLLRRGRRARRGEWIGGSGHAGR